MLITLWAKATENQHRKPLLRDEKAAEIISKIDYDFSKFIAEFHHKIFYFFLGEVHQHALYYNKQRLVIGLDKVYPRRTE